MSVTKRIVCEVCETRKPQISVVNINADVWRVMCICMACHRIAWANGTAKYVYVALALNPPTARMD
jgi:hypothetical protein